LTGAGTLTANSIVQNRAAIELGNSVAIASTATLNITGTGISNGGALRNVATTTSSYAGAITIGTGGARINSDSGTLTLTGGVVTSSGNNVTFGGAGNITVSTAAISGGGGLIKDGAGTLSLNVVANSYSGATTINEGKLKLGADNVLPSTAVSIGAATLDADIRTDTVGTLDVTAAATINLGSGGALAFANSSAINGGTWAGSLNITVGTLGSTSIKFGTTSGGLSAGQLAKVSVNGAELGSFILDANGYLVRPPGTLISFF
jgi:autotransporter-associated beta strand protein